MTAIIESKDTILITVTPATIEEVTAGFLSLKITDAASRELVAQARKTCVKLRTAAEKERVAVKAQALAECKRIDQHWKELFALIEPVELHLTKQENAVKEAEAAIERERIAKLVESRLESMERIGWDSTFPVDRNFLATASDDKFNEFRLELAKQISAKREDDRRRAEEAAKLAAERAELDEQRAEAERIRKAQQAELDAQRREIETQQKKLAEAQAESERIERERRQAAADAELQAARRAKVEALKPDHEKLFRVIDQLSGIEIPEVGPAAEYARVQIQAALQVAYDEIGRVLNGMVR